MARETKIGLLVGLGVIIFIGILVSDYLSVSQTQGYGGLTQPAEARAIVTPYQREQAMRDPGTTAVAPPVVDRTEQLPDPRNTGVTENPRGHGLPYEIYSVDDSATQHQPDVLVIGQSNDDQAAQQRVTDKIHHVQPGETLSGIAVKYYGDRNYWRTIFDANRDKMTSPERMAVGMRLIIPDRAPGNSATRGTDTAEQPTQTDRRTVTADAQYRDYTVQSGDSLSKLAQKFMGSQNKTNDLYELNRHVIRDPDMLVVGTVIRVPAR